jgi:hypothetical protein
LDFLGVIFGLGLLSPSIALVAGSLDSGSAPAAGAETPPHLGGARDVLFQFHLVPEAAMEFLALDKSLELIRLLAWFKTARRRVTAQSGSAAPGDGVS